MIRGSMMCLAALALLSSPGAATAAVPTPTVEGPISGGLGAPFVAGTTFDLDDVGYVAEEFFISGTASAWTSGAPLGADGLWNVVPGESAAYATRILVYRPKKAAKFNGSVVVEWLNVSGGLDSAPDWIAGHVQLIRDGFAWVGVSAQKIGVEGGTPALPGLPVLYLKLVDPERYGSLVHPGDSFSYDIFSQAGQALRALPELLGGLAPEALIAAGESQSAFRMVNYVNAIHPIAAVYDGFLIHSRAGFASFGTSLSESPQPVIRAPGSARIRADIDVPVLTLQTETDMVLFGSVFARQDDTDLVRLWEVAGTAHADTYTLVTGMGDLGRDPAVADVILTSSPLGLFDCPEPVNSGPLHFVLNSAFSALDRWVREGTPPPIAPRIEVTTSPLAIVRDAYGNAVGGIRMPQLDVPIASYSGSGNGGIACLLFGTTSVLDAATLQALYPSHGAYVSAFHQATSAAVRSGFLLGRDAQLLRAWAAGSDVGK